MTRPKSIKEKILEDRGLIEHQPAKHKHRKMVRIPPSPLDSLKTPLMRYLELRHHKPIQDMLMAGSLSQVAKSLGIDPSTVSKWIKHLKLRYNDDNLPNCEGCKFKRPTCSDTGFCYILVQDERWDLVELKRQEITKDYGGNNGQSN